MAPNVYLLIYQSFCRNWADVSRHSLRFCEFEKFLEDGGLKEILVHAGAADGDGRKFDRFDRQRRIDEGRQHRRLLPLRVSSDGPIST